MASLLERYHNNIRGVLSCFDRVIIQGTLPGLCYAAEMTTFLHLRRIRIFDYAKFAEPLRTRIRAHAEAVAEKYGLPIEFIRKLKHFRKEDRIHAILQQRGRHPGLVHIFSAMETCPSYKPWHYKQTGKTFLKPDSGKCLHDSFYFIDTRLGLCYLRVPTWCPFRLQFYFNGHNWLASQLATKGITYQRMDNAFTMLADFPRAQHLADAWKISTLHRALDQFVIEYCPVLKTLDSPYHWSLMQVEYATDMLFTSQEALTDLYQVLSRIAIHAVKANNVATFLGRKLTGRYDRPLGTSFTTRLKHQMGPVSLKLYDKFGLVLRIEVTASNVSFFNHDRTGEQRNGEKTFKVAPLKTSISSLTPDLRHLMLAANQRYLAFLSDLDDPTLEVQALRKLAIPVQANGRVYKGYNFFHPDDQRLFETLLRGEFTISGWRNKDLRLILHKTVSQVSAGLKRLRLHGLIKRIGRTYKYYLTRFGRTVLSMGLKLKELVVIPTLARELHPVR